MRPCIKRQQLDTVGEETDLSNSLFRNPHPRTLTKRETMQHANRFIIGCLAACFGSTAMAQSGARLDVSHLLAASKNMRDGDRSKEAPKLQSTHSTVASKASRPVVRKSVRRLSVVAEKPSSTTRGHFQAVQAPRRELTIGVQSNRVGKRELLAQADPQDPSVVAPERTGNENSARLLSKDTVSNSGGAVAYDIPMLTEDRSLTNPVNTWFYYFKMMPGVRMAKDGMVDLNFVTSPTLLTREGSLTIIFNGQPVGSRYLPSPKERGGENAVTNWQVSLPVRFFKTGFNEIRVVSRQRTSEGPCRDIDDAGNWIRFATSSKLKLWRTPGDVYPLFSYPFPYLDPLAPYAVNGPWLVSSNASSTELGAMFGIASDWGRREQQKPMPLQVSTNGSMSGYAVAFGSAATGTGVTATANGGGSKLSIAGTDATSLDNIRKTLARPEMVAQMEGTQAAIVGAPAASAEELGSKLGRFTLQDLGTPNMTLAGIYHQRTIFTVKRPLVTNLGKESYIRLKFRHSASLQPRRSILSVSMNGLPVGSVRLDKENTAGGYLVARLPVTELAKNSWNFEFAAYHDLELVDCSKIYDDIAWTVIDGASEFVLETGKLPGRPYLENFPYLTSQDGKPAAPATMRLSAKPSDQELTTAAIAAARAGQSNRYPIAWNVKLGADGGADGSGVMLGYYNEVDRFSGLKDLLVRPEGGDNFKLSERVQVLKSALAGGTLFQAIPAPGGKGGVLYVVLASDEEAMKRAGNVLADPKRAEELTGEACLLTRQGRIVNLVPRNSSDVETEQTTEKDRYTPPMKGAASILILGVILMAVLIWRQFRRPRGA